MMRGLYKLGPDRKPAPCMSVLEWTEAMQDEEIRRVGYYESEGVEISTVFLGLDHAFGRGRLQVFETAALCREGVRIIDRYATWEEAEAGHAAAVAAFKAVEK